MAIAEFEGQHLLLYRYCNLSLYSLVVENSITIKRQISNRDFWLKLLSVVSYVINTPTGTYVMQHGPAKWISFKLSDPANTTESCFALQFCKVSDQQLVQEALSKPGVGEKWKHRHVIKIMLDLQRNIWTFEIVPQYMSIKVSYFSILWWKESHS